MPSIVWFTQSELAIALECTPQWVRELTVAKVLTCKKRGTRNMYDLVASIQAHRKYRDDIDRAERTAHPADFEKARARKMEADADIAELERGKLSGALIERETHKRIIGEITDRFDACARGGHTRFLGDIQRALTVKEAQQLAETMDIWVRDAIHGVADDLEAGGATAEAAA